MVKLYKQSDGRSRINHSPPGIPFALSLTHQVSGLEARSYRRMNRQRQLMYVKFIGTHREYDAIDADTVEN
jgi:hypothetical protein